jgi:hypothetical protein
MDVVIINNVTCTYIHVYIDIFFSVEEHHFFISDSSAANTCFFLTSSRSSLNTSIHDQLHHHAKIKSELNFSLVFESACSYLL